MAMAMASSVRVKGHDSILGNRSVLRGIVDCYPASQYDNGLIYSCLSVTSFFAGFYLFNLRICYHVCQGQWYGGSYGVQ